MQTDNESELQSLVDSELRRLPLPRAPETLLPRILQAVNAAPRPWYARAWFTWPWPLRLASLTVLALLAYGFWRLPPAPPSVVAAVGTTRVLWDALIQPLLPYLVAVMLVMGVACA
ncbi:MAG TPA: hypothetical protein VFZ98_13510, partial [Vicinamibacterales bacterium]